MKDGIRIWRLNALCLILASAGSSAADEPVTELAMSAEHQAISRRVSRFIENIHYSRPRIDDSLSSAIFDRYLDILDGNRLYFLQGDYSTLGSYRYELDERVRSGELQPIFEIFNFCAPDTRSSSPTPSSFWTRNRTSPSMSRTGSTARNWDGPDPRRSFGTSGACGSNTTAWR